MAIHSGAPYQTHAFPSTLHDYLFKALQCIRPAFSFVTAVKIGGRSVNLLYGHRTEPIELSPIVLSDMSRLCEAAGHGCAQPETLDSKSRAGNPGKQERIGRCQQSCQDQDSDEGNRGAAEQVCNPQQEDQREAVSQQLQEPG